MRTLDESQDSYRIRYVLVLLYGFSYTSIFPVENTFLAKFLLTVFYYEIFIIQNDIERI